MVCCFSSSLIYVLTYAAGGARRGTDVIKALCLGARAVGMGRPFLYAQSVSTRATFDVEFPRI